MSKLGIAVSATAAVVAISLWWRRRRPVVQSITLVKSVSPRARVFATLGDPVDIVRTPLIFPAALGRTAPGVDAVLVPLHVPPQALGTAFEALRQFGNLDGFVITKPHKEAAAKLCDELSVEARAVGAVNVARVTSDGRRIIGAILDGVGFTDGLEACGHAVKGKRFLLLGAGVRRMRTRTQASASLLLTLSRFRRVAGRGQSHRLHPARARRGEYQRPKSHHGARKGADSGAQQRQQWWLCRSCAGVAS